MMIRYDDEAHGDTLNRDLKRFIATCFEKNTFFMMVAGSNFILVQSNLSGCVDTWKPTWITLPSTAATIAATNMGSSTLADSNDDRTNSLQEASLGDGKTAKTRSCNTSSSWRMMS